MEREQSLSKAYACRATHNQKLITNEQLQLIQSFLLIGNQNSSLREYVLRKTVQSPEIWNQTLIFLALVSFRPSNSKIVPPLRIDDVWHMFILCTKEYSDFCQKAGGRYLHHVPDALSSGKFRKKWFKNNKRLTQFLDGQVPEFCEDLWEDPWGFEIITRERFEYHKQRALNLSFNLSHRSTHRSGCDSCGERCAD